MADVDTAGRVPERVAGLPTERRRTRLQWLATASYLTVAAVAAVLPAARDTAVSQPFHIPYIGFLGLAALWAAWGAWSRFRLDRESQSFLLCAGFASLAVVYLPHALYEPSGKDPAHMFFSPMSRLVFGVFLVLAMLRIPLPKVLQRPAVGLVALAILGAVVVDVAAHTTWLLERLGAQPKQSVRTVGIAALAVQAAALAVLAVRWSRTRRRFLGTVAAGVICLAAGGALIDFTGGWQWRWWAGHLGLLAAAVILAIGTSQQLARAIDDDELVLHYQPKVQLDTGELHGVEALVRWQHPDRGLLSPVVFVPVAESTEMIGPLTEWVLREALDQHERWRAEGLRIPVAVNVSARLLRDGRFGEVVRSELEQRKLDAGALELELTESAVMEDEDVALASANALAALDVRLAIDDFGTGYASLGYLKRLPVTEVKIDKSFVTNLVSDPDDRLIVRSTVELAHGLGKHVVAEGVEDEAVRAELQALGCDVGQGYLWSKPLPADELAAWARSRAASTAAAASPAAPATASPATASPAAPGTSVAASPAADSAPPTAPAPG